MANRRIKAGTLVILTYSAEQRYPSVVEAHGVMWLIHDEVSKKFYILKSLASGHLISMNRRDFVRSDNKGTRLGERPQRDS